MESQFQDKLILKVTVFEAGAVGYGYLFKCQVMEVLEGQLVENNIILCVLASDKDNENFMFSHLSPLEVEISFRKKFENEPHSIMPLTGFVDNQNTSWEVVSMK